MDYRIIQTILLISAFFILRVITVKFLSKIQHKYAYSKYRVKQIMKFLHFFIFILVATLVTAIWGIEQSKLLTFVTSVIAVVGVALFAQWSILSNILSALIIFISHPIKLGESITILDKEFEILGEVSDISLFYVTLLTNNKEKIKIPNNIFLQKATKVHS